MNGQTEQVEQEVVEETVKEEIKNSDSDSKWHGSLLIIPIILVVVLAVKLVLPVLKSSRFGATSVINESTQEGYIDELFKTE